MAVNGETAGKERGFATDDEATLDELGLGPHRTTDDHLKAHPCILQQGARLADSNTDAVLALIIAFNEPSKRPKPPTLADKYMRRVSRVGVGLLVFYTLASTAVAVLGYGAPLSHDLLVELFLVNNVSLPMTLVRHACSPTRGSPHLLPKHSHPAPPPYLFRQP